MNFLDGITNFAMLISEHWLEITFIIGVFVKVYSKVQEYLAKSDDEKAKAKEEAIERAKKNAYDFMLKYVCESEQEYAEWVKAGEAKRAAVIDRVFTTYPILLDVVDRDELIAFLDKAINDALKKMRELLKEKEKMNAHD